MITCVVQPLFRSVHGAPGHELRVIDSARGDFHGPGPPASSEAVRSWLEVWDDAPLGVFAKQLCCGIRLTCSRDDSVLYF